VDTANNVQFLLGLCRLVVEAKDENTKEASIKMLREICVNAVNRAPVHALATLGRCLAYLGEEARLDSIQEN
jgi:hypothetical protein